MKRQPPNAQYDVAIVGAGIVGLATAHRITRSRPELNVVVVEKEAAPGQHQSGRNSGVLHSGLYYSPGSHKSTMVAQGRQQLLDFCESADVPYEICGKIVVATRDAQLPQLDTLADRGVANGLEIERLSADDIRAVEPHVSGVAGLRVPAAGIVDFGFLCEALAAALAAAGGEVLLGTPVTEVASRPDGVTLSGPWGAVRAAAYVNCAGLHSDRIASLAGADRSGIRILPFRGEYHELKPSARHLVRNLVYPLPDPAFPFLGVHFTRATDGTVHVGPNAVMALSREGYRWRDVNPSDLREILGAAGTWRLAREHWRTGLAEVHRSLSRRAFLRAARQLLPELRSSDLVGAPAGVRAQAVGTDGRLIDDFVIRPSHGGIHVLNAPSPAASASFAIGSYIADLVATQVG